MYKPPVIRKKCTHQIRKVLPNTEDMFDTFEAPNTSVALQTQKSHVLIGITEITRDTAAETSLLGVKILRYQNFEIKNLNTLSKETNFR